MLEQLANSLGLGDWARSATLLSSPIASVSS